MSQALKDGTIKRWLALDQDQLSVGAVAMNTKAPRSKRSMGSVRTVLMRSQTLGKFDFVYAAGPL